MKQRIFSHFQDYLIQYISHQYQDLLYCNSSQYILSTYNSQHNNNNNNNFIAKQETLQGCANYNNIRHTTYSKNSNQV